MRIKRSKRTIDKFEIDFLPVGDADAILLHLYVDDTPYTVVIDAGNVGDGKMVARHIKQYYTDNMPSGKYCVDLAICTHPDKDHKGGFFDLLEDDEIHIEKFCLIDPGQHIDADDVKRYRLDENVHAQARKIFNKPYDDSQNLIDILKAKKVDIIDGLSSADLGFGLSIVAPTEEYYVANLQKMVNDYGLHTYEKIDSVDYDEAIKVDSYEAKSTMDNENNDGSPYNAGSLVVLFEPNQEQKYLFAGDADKASLSRMIQDHPEVQGASLKVPHHGSIHNLTTKIIDDLSPVCSYICAKGNLSHPSRAVVYWLSKYGDVYSTHKVHGYLHHNGGMPDRAGSTVAQKLKGKI